MKKEPRTVIVHKRLRPLRLAFLVRPGDKSSLRRIIQINTCLWGGRFNAIIPVYKKTPSRWTERLLRAPSAREIVSGYFDAFEPDFVVAIDASLADGLKIPKGRLLSQVDVLNPNADEPIGYGVDVVDAFSDLYQKEFQFLRRHPVEVVWPEIQNHRMSLMMAACFGEFPDDEQLKYLRQGYLKAFDADRVTVEPSNLLKLFIENKFYPLRIGFAGIDIQRSGWRVDPALFYMDSTSILDIIDFWNLRAIGWQVLPLPRQWANDLIEDCSKFIAHNYVPYRHNKEMMHGTTIVCSRSSSFEEMQRFAKNLKNPGQRALSLQHWYPRMWDEWARDKDHVLRCDLVAKESATDLTVSDERIHFRDLSPDFVDRFGGRGSPRWSNVIEIHDYSGLADSASVIPSGVPDLNRTLETFTLGDVWATREGIVLTCKHVNWNHSWRLPTAFHIFHAWMKEKGFELNISSPGKIATQVIRALGGIWGIDLLANEEILNLLNKMAHGQVEQKVSGEKDREAKSKVRTQTVPRKTWWNLLLKVNRNYLQAAERHLNALISCRVLRVGLKLQCPECSQHTWFDLDTLSESVTCERCLQDFNFPSASPPIDDWHYRAIGPFSVENYAQGSYCVALSLRFLSNTINAETTCIPSFNLKGQKLEADFGIFWRRSQFERTDPILILGECKTHDLFEAKDVRRMKSLAEAFPGAVIAFCTLRKQLEPVEKKRITQLAQRGRRHLRADMWHNPVLILTGIELFSDHGPPYCWQDAGGSFAQFANTYRGHDEIQELCGATQQLHFGMESYRDWLEKERTKRQVRRSRKKA
jgi:hypothetical protein